MMYLKEEQETVINIHEESGEITLYTCAPQYVIKAIEAADKFKMPLTIRDVVNGYPQAVEIQSKNMQMVHFILGNKLN
ncbi:hypothetical protein L2D08_22320 [Domibacillus sp. PGB-M46]|uniref:hypothetical protein n=1 Tax=Domibacillus sp. PGB-M46 TaxID=2910255 RepID=UPI001F5A3A65|nr:hypothetical protein [Domibacillus sp. PGB-M46]MCI2257062.1 hypothetical protein [Domibacillus sp. PGB-M46]